MNNVQAEYILLGCILIDNEIIKELTLTDEQFYEFENKQLFNAMKNLSKNNQPINHATIQEELGEANFNYIGGKALIDQLKDTVPSVHGFNTYERIIVEHWKTRELKDVLQKQMDKLDTKEIQNIINELNKIDQTGTRQKFNMTKYLVEMYELPITEVPKGLSGIPSGFVDLDLMTDGFQDEDSIIVGARPSMGKTAFVLNIAINAAKKDVIPIIFSLEMSAEQLIKRTLSAIGRIDGVKTRNPYHYFNDKDRESWVTAIGMLEKMNFQIFDEPNQTVSGMRAKVRQIKKDFPNKKILVMIDYLTLISPSQSYNGNAHLQVSEISRDLKTLAKEFKCPVITLAQLSRGVETRSEKKPYMSDLRESGSIEQDADVIMFLYRDEYYNETTQENKNILEVNIAKQRNGPVGSIELYYDKEKNLIKNK